MKTRDRQLKVLEACDEANRRRENREPAPATRRHYLIDWVWADGDLGQFGTQADLSDAERDAVETFINRQSEAGVIHDPHIYEPSKPLHQDFATLRTELIEALGCEDDTCRTCLAAYDHAGDGYDGECPECADETEAKRAAELRRKP